MAHVRELIRKRIGLILNGLALKPSVFLSMVYNLEPSQLPAIKIYTRSEDVERDSLTYPRGTFRQLQVIIEIAVKSVDGYNDLSDLISAQVETAISADITLSGLTKDIYLDTLNEEMSDGGDKPHMSLYMSYIAEYRVLETDPETVLD